MYAIDSSVHPFNHLSIHIYTHPCIYSNMYFFINSLIHLSGSILMHAFIYSLIYNTKVKYQSVIHQDNKKAFNFWDSHWKQKVKSENIKICNCQRKQANEPKTARGQLRSRFIIKGFFYRTINYTFETTDGVWLQHNWYGSKLKSYKKNNEIQVELRNS